MNKHARLSAKSCSGSINSPINVLRLITARYYHYEIACRVSVCLSERPSVCPWRLGILISLSLSLSYSGACHEDVSTSSRQAVARPKLSGRRSSSTVLKLSARFASVFQFFVASLWEDPECRPGELGSGLDQCRHGTDDQGWTRAVDG